MFAPKLSYSNESISVSRHVAVKGLLKDLTMTFNAEIKLQIIYADSERSLVPQLYSNIRDFDC